MRKRTGPAANKTRITIRLDDDVLAWFREQVRSSGGSYQKAINLALRDSIAREPIEATLRRVVREELARAEGRQPSSRREKSPEVIEGAGSRRGSESAARESGSRSRPVRQAASRRLRRIPE